MAHLAFADVNVGDSLPPLALPALDRTTLALFAGASGDHVPLHIDTDVARKAGMPTCSGTDAVDGLPRATDHPVGAAGDASQPHARFVGITHLGNAITCRQGRRQGRARRREVVRLEIQAANQYGELKTAGTAVIALR